MPSIARSQLRSLGISRQSMYLRATVLPPSVAEFSMLRPPPPGCGAGARGCVSARAPGASTLAAMADTATIASLATAGGTLVLAVATFSATRSANRSARISEQSLKVGLRPVLFNARPQDPPQKVG